YPPVCRSIGDERGVLHVLWPDAHDQRFPVERLEVRAGRQDLRGHGQPAPASRSPPNSTTPDPSEMESFASTMFMAGEPMKPATKRLFGWSYRNWGVSTCWRTPLRMTATRSPMVMAST